jgi:hypothetical protein
MFWELSLDARPGEGGEALVPMVAREMGGLEWRENELDYLESSEWLVCLADRGGAKRRSGVAD